MDRASPIPCESDETPLVAPLADLRPELGAIYAAHFTHVWHTLRRYGVVERDLEDAAHEVFLVVHRRLGDYDPSRPLRPWLSGIAWRVASDERRRARHHRERLGHTSEPVSARPAADDAVATARDRQLVVDTLEELPDDQRRVFVMYELDEAGMPEIAEALAVPLNTAYSRLRLARKRFADAVRRRRPDETNETNETNESTGGQR